MRDSAVHLSEIKITNFKNVKTGSLHFHNRRKEHRASILGLYGQNGSGKTALIDTLQLLKYILCGKPVPVMMADYVHVEADHATIVYKFDVTVPTATYEAYYEVKIRKEEDISDQNLDVEEEYEKKPRLVIYDEVLSYSFEGTDKKIRKGSFIDTRTEDAFVPVTKYDSLIGKDKDTMMNLLVAKKMAAGSSRSFVFSRELLNYARKHHSQTDDDPETMRHLRLLERLIVYGHYELFVINTENAGMISMNAMPLAFKYQEMGGSTVGKMMLTLDDPVVISSNDLEVVKKVTRNMNIVLEQIIPGLTISLRELGAQVMEDGKEGRRIQLMSSKNSKEIPLKNESEGIKKIISILQLLIAVYNQSSITVAIDELDSGIFEYLLGELLRVISEKGKGQLIFTSHNLRPLETLDRGFIAFTTTNPSKRYIRMTNIKDTHNLRDFYFRDIVLGEQREEVYELTNNAEIALAFREAGEISGS